MSDFILNLVQRGAGLAPRKAVQASAVQATIDPVFRPEPGSAQEAASEPKMLAVDGAGSEVGMAGKRVSDPERRPGSEKTAGPQPQERQSPISQTPAKPAAPPLRLPRKKTDPGSVRTSKTPHPPLTQAEGPTSTPLMGGKVRPQIGSVSYLETGTKAQAAASVPEAIPVSGRPSDASVRRSPAQQPAPAGSTAKPRTPLDLPEESQTGATVPLEAHHTTPGPQDPVAPEPQALPARQPALPRMMSYPTVVITPAPIPSPVIPKTAERGTGSSAPRPIRVHIGTIEVRATPPPAPAPTPRGFGNYARIRNYINWER